MKTVPEPYQPPCIKVVEIEVEQGFAWSIGNKSFGTAEDDLWE